MKKQKSLRCLMCPSYCTLPLLPTEVSVIKEKYTEMFMQFFKGLCGAVHSNVFRAIRGDLAKDDQHNIKVVCVGDKSRGIIQRWYSKNIIMAAKEVGRLPPTFLDAARLANAIFTSGYNYSAGKIIYNQFNSVVSNTIKFLPVFSLSAVQVSLTK